MIKSKLPYFLVMLLMGFPLSTHLWPQGASTGPTSYTPPIRIGQSELSPGGYFQFRYSYTDEGKRGTDSPDTLDLIKVRFWLDGRISSDIEAKVQYDLLRSTLMDLRLKISRLPYTDWQVTLGQFKLPFSVAGEIEGTPRQETVRVPLIYAGGKTTFSTREIGIMAQADMLDKKGQYSLGIFNGNGINKSDDNDNKDRLVQFRVWPWRNETLSPLKPMEFGAAWIRGEVTETNSIGTDTREKYVYTVKYEINQVFITYEYFVQTLDVDGPIDINTKAWYLLLTRNEEMFFLNQKQSIQSVLRYEYYDPDSTTSNDKIRVRTVGANWQINPALRLQVNYNDFDEDAKTRDKETLIQLEVKF